MMALLAGLIPLATKYWKILAVVGAVAALYLLWQSDRHSQYLLGVADNKAELEKLINRSTELKDNEKRSAHDLATSAARSVCEQQGANPSDCDGL